tara:strand:+ start:68 stop:1177 length:1110 start_codon:yes stop_codon:yes gene_type:complete
MAKDEELQRKLGSMFIRTRGWNKDNGSGWKMIQRGEHAGKWQKYKNFKPIEGQIKENPDAIWNIADFSPSGWNVTEYGQSLSGAAYENLTKPLWEKHDLETLEKKLENFKNRGTSGTQRRANSKLIQRYESAIAKKRELLEKEKQNKAFELEKLNRGQDFFEGSNAELQTNQVVEGQTGEIDSEYQMPDLISIFSQTMENGNFSDQDLYKLTESKNLVENLGQFDTQFSYTNIAKMDPSNFYEPPAWDKEGILKNYVNYTPKTENNNNELVETNNNNNEVVEINNNEAEIQQTPTWDKGQIWSRGSGTSLRDANAATLQIIKDQGYDLRGLGQFDQANLARDWRLGRFNNMDKDLFYQSNQGHKRIRKL